MTQSLDRANMLRPYTELHPYDVWALHVLVLDDPEGEDVEASLNHLLDLIESRIPAGVSWSERDIKFSICNAAGDLAATFYGLSDAQRSIQSRKAIGRFLGKRPTDEEGRVLQRTPPRRTIDFDGR